MRVEQRRGESVFSMVRRLKKQLERSGKLREIRQHATYVKPSEKRRRKKAHRQKMCRRAMAEGNPPSAPEIRPYRSWAWGSEQ